MEEYARNEFRIYKVIGKYERNRGDNLCVQLGDFYTGEFEGEEYESNLKLGNLIDLLEVGDYVNGRLVLAIDYEKQNICLLIPLTDTKANTNIMWYGYEDIKTILTHEQFEANAYKVKGE